MRIPLDVATRLEPRLRNDLSLMEYLKFATLGSKVWDFQQFDEICTRLIPVAENSRFPEEQAFAYMVVAHLKFKYHERIGSLAPAREFCAKAADPLERKADSLDKFYYLGQIYANWALHERCWGLPAEGTAKAHRAEDWWGRLSIRQRLISKLRDDLDCVGSCREPEVLSPTFLLDPTVVLAAARASDLDDAPTPTRADRPPAPKAPTPIAPARRAAPPSP